MNGLRAIRTIKCKDSDATCKMNKLTNAIEFGKEWDDRDITYVAWSNALEESKRKKQEQSNIDCQG